jgi:hypothetical protein
VLIAEILYAPEGGSAEAEEALGHAFAAHDLGNHAQVCCRTETLFGHERARFA